jgi:hypothetical protein
MTETDRDNTWLANRLEQLRQRCFEDVAIGNLIQVRFGRITKTRLGSITTRRLAGKPAISLITINGLFRNQEVPAEVIDAVLGHEFTHYAHGWHSPHPKLYSHPHRGGIVDKELLERGLGSALKEQQRWVKGNFARLYRAERPLAKPRLWR